MTAKKKQQAEAESQARQMTDEWAKHVAEQGFFGGVRVVSQTQDGVFTANPKYIGDPVLAKKIPIASTVEGQPQPLPGDTEPKVITQPLPWWRRVLNFLFAEKTK